MPDETRRRRQNNASCVLRRAKPPPTYIGRFALAEGAPGLLYLANPVEAGRTIQHGMNQIRIWKGRPNPLGATVTNQGVNFALFAENATGVDLCLFDSPDQPTETLRVRMT